MAHRWTINPAAGRRPGAIAAATILAVASLASPAAGRDAIRRGRCPRPARPFAAHRSARPGARPSGAGGQDRQRPEGPPPDRPEPGRRRVRGGGGGRHHPLRRPVPLRGVEAGRAGAVGPHDRHPADQRPPPPAVRLLGGQRHLPALRPRAPLVDVGVDAHPTATTGTAPGRRPTTCSPHPGSSTWRRTGRCRRRPSSPTAPPAAPALGPGLAVTRVPQAWGDRDRMGLGRATAKGWRRTQNGEAHVDAAGKQVTPANVVVQFVSTTTPARSTAPARPFPRPTSSARATPGCSPGAC